MQLRENLSNKIKNNLTGGYLRDVINRTYLNISYQQIQAFNEKALSSILDRIDESVLSKNEKSRLITFVNEINTIPGFTSISMYPKMWEASGFMKSTPATPGLPTLAWRRLPEPLQVARVLRQRSEREFSICSATERRRWRPSCLRKKNAAATPTAPKHPG